MYQQVQEKSKKNLNCLKTGPNQSCFSKDLYRYAEIDLFQLNSFFQVKQDKLENWFARNADPTKEKKRLFP